MAWTVDNIYQLLLKLSRTNQSGRISATDFFYLWNAEQQTMFTELLGPWQARAGSKTGANTGLLLNDIVQSDLAPFVKNASLALSGGAITKPSDYKLKLAASLNGKPVDFLTHGQKAQANASVIDPPSTTTNTYYATEYAATFKLLPGSATGNVDFDYLAVPTDVVWGYTLDGNSRQVYASGSSVQPQWYTPESIAITKRVMKTLGVAFKDQDFVNAGQSAQMTGA